MFHLIIILALLPYAVGAVLWCAIWICAGIAWLFMAPFRLVGWLLNAAMGA